MIDKLRHMARTLLPKSLVGVLRGRSEGARLVLHPDFLTRFKLARSFQLATEGIDCTQSEPESMLVARILLSLPRIINGDVAECGCFMGGSTAKYSHVCGALGRRLKVFDSFQGLPEEKAGKPYYNFIDKVNVSWTRGDYQAGLATVRRNVAAFGLPEVVDWVPGFFEESLPGWQGQLAAIILDVDLVESTKTALRYLYPRLSSGGLVFSQDAHLEPIVELFENETFWRDISGLAPPKFVGLHREKMVYAWKP